MIWHSRVLVSSTNFWRWSYDLNIKPFMITIQHMTLSCRQMLYRLRLYSRKKSYDTVKTPHRRFIFYYFGCCCSVRSRKKGFSWYKMCVQFYDRFWNEGPMHAIFVKSWSLFVCPFGWHALWSKYFELIAT